MRGRARARMLRAMGDTGERAWGRCADERMHGAISPREISEEEWVRCGIEFIHNLLLKRDVHAQCELASLLFIGTHRCVTYLHTCSGVLNPRDWSSAAISENTTSVHGTTA